MCARNIGHKTAWGTPKTWSNDASDTHWWVIDRTKIRCAPISWMLRGSYIHTISNKYLSTFDCLDVYVLTPLHSGGGATHTVHALFHIRQNKLHKYNTNACSCTLVVERRPAWCTDAITGTWLMWCVWISYRCFSRASMSKGHVFNWYIYFSWFIQPSMCERGWWWIKMRNAFCK